MLKYGAALPEAKPVLAASGFATDTSEEALKNAEEP